MIEILIIALYIFFLTFVLAYSLVQLNLTVLYLKSKKRIEQKPKAINDFDLPKVLVQLPVYNEKYVVQRLVDSIASLDYPNNKLEIQILDDSNDETSAIIKRKVVEYVEKGIDIGHVQRPDRIDFKAGALQYGLQQSSADYVAIFDADFMPKPDFLKKTLPYFANKKVGLVQSRWEHLNYNYSLLTRLQAYVLNAHFTVDQKGRNYGKHFINFNGTAGIWRRDAITTSGGWQGDTLTEDLDLSYRAQLGGWQFVYLEDLESPAELPSEMNALKSQQFRWAKGAAECAVKNLGKVLKSNTVKGSTKANAVFHLLNSFNWVGLLGSSILLLPFVITINNNPQYEKYLSFMSVYYISFVLLFVYYGVGNSKVNFKTTKDLLQFAVSYPFFIALMMGMSVYNTIGVIEGYLRIRTSFIRTPKFNIIKNNDKIKERAYISLKFNFVTVVEIGFLLYFIYNCFYLIQNQIWGAVPFSLMMVVGVFSVLFLSSFHFYRVK